MTVRETARKMNRLMLVLALVVVAIGAVVYILRGEPVEFVLFTVGACIGTVGNILKVFSMIRTVEATVEMTNTLDAESYNKLQAFLRMGITVGTLFAAHFLPFSNVWGALAVILNLKIAFYTQAHYFKKEDKIKSLAETQSEIQVEPQVEPSSLEQES